MQPPGSLVTAELLDRAHRKGIEVHAWTINERDEMDALLAIGTDGIITDDPAELAKAIAALAE